ncbi:DUF6318 family protein [Promicromonospora citrea]|nr:DUF6318 family protein [Promicromonospora citrea]NNH51454.1 hypothetical protein [Promicromonospora citrea]
MLMRGVRAGLGVLVGLALLGPVLMGCTDSAAEPDDGASSPRVSAETSASPSPSAPAKPERPEAMNRDDAEGAAAAAEYFIELYPYVMATGDTEEFEAMSHRACGFCSQALEDVSRAQAQDRAYEGGEIAMTLVEQYERDEVTGIYPLDVEVTQQASRTTAADGSVVSSAEESVSEHRVEMGRRNGRWVVVAIAPRAES